MRRSLAFAVIVLATTGRASAAGKLPFTLSKETTAIVAPLKPDGSPDYLATINAEHSQGVTPENNGFVVWVKLCRSLPSFDPMRDPQLLKMLGLKPEDSNGPRLETYMKYAQRVGGVSSDDYDAFDEPDLLWKEPWKPEDHPRVAAYLKDQQAALQDIVASAKRDKWWIPCFNKSGNLFGAFPPGLLIVRDAASHLCIRATLRTAAGDRQGCVDDVIAAKRIGGQLATGASLYERLNAIAIDNRANQTLAAMVSRGDWHEHELQHAMNALATLPPIRHLTDEVNQWERWTALDFVEIFAFKRPHIPGEGRGLPWSLESVAWDSVDVDRMLRRINTAFDSEVELVEIAAVPEMRQKEAALEKQLGILADSADEQVAKTLSMRSGETREAYSDRVLAAMLSPELRAPTKVEELRRRDVLDQDMLNALLQAALQKSRTAVWPRSAENLPADPYANDGAPVRYVVEKNGPRIYSLGPNGKDDGGIKDDNGKDDIAVGVQK